MPRASSFSSTSRLRGSAKKSATALAMIGPRPRSASSFSAGPFRRHGEERLEVVELVGDDARRHLAHVGNAHGDATATASPPLGLLQSQHDVLGALLSHALELDQLLEGEVEQVGDVARSSPARTSCATSDGPRFSMFIASRLREELESSARAAPGSRHVFGQRSATCPSARTSGVAAARAVRRLGRRAPVAARSTTAMTCGMISPAFSMSTRSPWPTPSRWT